MILYFTDDRNEPRKINATRAIKQLYPTSFYSGTTAQKQEQLALLKQAPQAPPVVELGSDSARFVNNLGRRQFQFAYCYVYTDGERSAFSPWSDVAFNNLGIDSSGRPIFTVNQYNKITVTVDTKVTDVNKIRIYVKESANGAWQFVEEIDNDSSVSTIDYDFYNDAIYTPVTEFEYGKNFDNVPDRGQAISIVGGRCVIGNYTDGNNIPEIVMEANPYSKPVQLTPTIDVTNSSASNAPLNETYNSVDLEIDLSNLPEKLEQDAVFTIDFYVAPKRIDFALNTTITLTGFEGVTSKTFYINSVKLSVKDCQIQKTVSATTGTTRADIAAAILAAIEGGSYTMDIAPVQYANAATSTPLYSNVGLSTLDRYASFTGNLTIGCGGGSYNSGTQILSTRLKVNNISASINRTFASTSPYQSYPFSANQIINNFADAALGPASTWVQWNVSKNSSTINYTLPIKTFKSDQYHNLGIVYADNRGRLSSVVKVPTTFVSYMGGETQLEYQTRLDLRIQSLAPVWATRYHIVYSDQRREFIQYSVSEAFSQAKANSTTNPDGNYIAVSLRSLLGKAYSYVDATGAKMSFDGTADFEISRGDVLKILRYFDNSLNQEIYPANYKFNVVDFAFYASEDETPIDSDSGAISLERRTGWFVLLKDEEYQGFNSSAIDAGTDFWSKDCIVEVEKQNPISNSDVYRELGISFPITNRRHEGTRDFFDGATINGVVNNPAFSTLKMFLSDDPVFEGDVVTNGVTESTVTRVYEAPNGKYLFTIPASYSNALTTLTITNYEDTIVSITEGNVYLSPRQVRLNELTAGVPDKTKLNGNRRELIYLESMNFSDFFPSNMMSFGRAHIYDPSYKRRFRVSELVYSEEQSFDTERLTLSSFNPLLANFKTLNTAFGAVRAIVNNQDSCHIIMTSKCFVIPVGRNVVEYDDGNANTTISNQFLGQEASYMGDYGCGDNPESVYSFQNRTYFADKNSGKICQIGGDGISLISENQMDGWWETTLKAARLASVSKIFSAVNTHNDTLLFSGKRFEVYDIEVDYDDGVASPTNTTATNLQVPATGDIKANFVVDESVTFNNTRPDAGAYSAPYNKGVMFLDDPTQKVIMFSDVSLTDPTDKGILISTYDKSIILTGSINTTNGSVLINQSDPYLTGFVTTDPTLVDGSEYNAVYSLKDKRWITFITMYPEMMESVANALYVFNTGNIYAVDSSSYNNFFGTTSDTVVASTFNNNDSMMKVFTAFSIEGDNTADVTFDNDSGVAENTYSSSVMATDFDNIEGYKYISIPRNTLYNESKGLVSLGIPAVINASGIITFDHIVSNIPFRIGGTVWRVRGTTATASALTVLSIDSRRQIRLSANPTSFLQAGDIILVAEPNAVSGEEMRDILLNFTANFDPTSYFEITAFNSRFANSKLHNELINQNS